MDTLKELLTLPGPLTTGDAFFIMWFLGFVAGYCTGRAHAAWITLREFVRRNS